MKTDKSLSTKKVKSLRFAKQAQGALDKVISMIEENRYCPEIIQQTDSTIGLLRAIKKELLAGHLDTCASNRFHEDKNNAIKELLKIYNLSN